LAWTLLLGGAGLNVFERGEISRSHTFKRRLDMLWTILVILLVLWLVGLLSHVGGGLIHLLLVIAAIVLVINLLTGRRAV
jgi:hypothetical protein